MDYENVKLLMEIGFNELEARVYLSLLQEPNSTGYRIAKLLGKPVPNTYKAMEALMSKGAIIRDDTSRPQLYAAIPIKEYLDQLERNFEVRRVRLEKSLRDMGSLEKQEGIFRLHNIDQLFERGLNMLQSARDVVLVDVKRGVLEKIQSLLERTARKGVKVLIQGPDQPVSGCEVIPISRKVEENPYAWFNMVVDGEQYLSSLVKENEDGIYEAFWSKNLYLSVTTHFSYLNEFVLTRLLAMLEEQRSGEEILGEVRRLFTEYYLNAPIIDKVKSFVHIGGYAN